MDILDRIVNVVENLIAIVEFTDILMESSNLRTSRWNRRIYGHFRWNRRILRNFRCNCEFMDSLD